MATVDYPSTIPGPSQLSSEPKVRARSSGLPGSEGYTAPERDYYGTLSVSFFFNRDQARIFKEWWDTNQGYWFNAVWPRLSQSLSVYRILGVPTFTHVYDGAYRVSAKVELRGASLAVQGPETGDAFWLDNIALLPFDSGITNFAPGGVSFNSTGTSISTNSKYGSGSLAVNGTAPGGGGPNGLYGVSPSSANGWGLTEGDFTAEAWVYLNSYPTSGTYGPILRTAGEFSGTEINFRVSESGWVDVIAASSESGQTVLTAGPPIALNQWTHVALSRASGFYRIFRGGVNLGGFLIPYSRPTGTKVVQIGTVGGFGMDALLDDLRVTKAARYLDTFSPPSRAHPTAH